MISFELVVAINAGGRATELLRLPANEYMQAKFLRLKLAECKSQAKRYRRATSCLVDVIDALNMTVPGCYAHLSAMKDGETLKIPQYSL